MNKLITVADWLTFNGDLWDIAEVRVRVYRDMCVHGSCMALESIMDVKDVALMFGNYFLNNISMFEDFSSKKAYINFNLLYHDPVEEDE